MGYRHSADELLAVAVDIALTDGIGSVSFGAVARHAGISDRMVVYYFPRKADLIASVVADLTQRLELLLADVVDGEPLRRDALLRRVWSVLADPRADPLFAVYFEVLGKAATGAEPYRSLAQLQIEAWVDWLRPRLAAHDPTSARQQALALLAQLDGLLLLRQLRGPAVAEEAARELGIS